MANVGEGDVFLLDGESARRLIDDAVNDERQLDTPGRRPQRAPASFVTQFCLVTSDTQNANTFWPGKVQFRDTATKTWTDFGNVWVESSTGEGLKNNQRPYCRLVGLNAADGLPVFETCAVGADPGCCPGNLGGKPLGGGAILGGTNCCCTGGTTPPPGGIGGTPLCNDPGNQAIRCSQYTRPIVINGLTWWANAFGIGAGEVVWCGPGPEPANGPGPGWIPFSCGWICLPALMGGSCFGGISGTSGGGGVISGGGGTGGVPGMSGGFTRPSPVSPGLPNPIGTGQSIDGGGVSLPYPTPGIAPGTPLFRNTNPPRPVYATPIGGGPLGGGGSAFIFPSEGGTGTTSPGASGNVLTSNGTAWVSLPPGVGGQTINPTISASQNDYSFGGLVAVGGDNVVVLASSGVGPWDITGIAISQVDRTRLTIIKTASAPNVVLKHNSASSGAANKMRLGNAAVDITLTGDKTVSFIYDGTQGNWKMTANSN